MEGRLEESLHVKAHVRHLDQTNTAVADSLLTQRHADHHITRMSSREPVQEHIATPLMTAQAHSHARLTIMP